MIDLNKNIFFEMIVINLLRTYLKKFDRKYYKKVKNTFLIIKLLRPVEKFIDFHLYRCNKTRNIYISIYHVKVLSIMIILSPC